MAEAFQPLEYTIKTAADVRALQTFRKEAQEALKNPQADAAALKRQLDAVDRALASDAAQAAKLVEQLQRVKAARKAINPRADTSALDAQIGGLRSKLGAGMVDQFREQMAGIVAAGRELPVIGRFFNALTGWAAAAGAAIGVAAKSLKEFAGAERGLTSLNAALAQNGQLTTDNARRYADLAGELQAATGIADDEWVRVLTTLTKFGSSPESIGMDVEAVKNLAGLMEGDLQRAALLIAKANQGNFEGFRRVGIQIDANATQADKLRSMYEQLAQRGGQQLEAQNRTLSGQWQQLKNASSDFFEGLGAGIGKSEAVRGTLYGLARTLEWITGFLPKTSGQIDGLANAAGKAATPMDDAADGANSLADGIARIGENAKESLGLFSALSDAISAREREQLAEVDASAAVALSQLEVKRKRGQISEPDYLAQKNAIQQGAKDRQLAIKEQAAREKVQTGEAGLSDINAQIRTAQENAAVRRAQAADSVAAPFADEQKTKAFIQDLENQRAAAVERIGRLVKNYTPEQQRKFYPEIASIDTELEAKRMRLNRQRGITDAALAGVPGASREALEKNGVAGLKALADQADQTADALASSLYPEILKFNDLIRQGEADQRQIGRDRRVSEAGNALSAVAVEEARRKAAGKNTEAQLAKEMADIDSQLARGGGNERALRQRKAELEYFRGGIGLDDPQITPAERAAREAQRRATFDQSRRDATGAPAGAVLPPPQYPTAPVPTAPTSPRAGGPPADLKPVSSAATSAADNIAGVAEAANAMADLASAAASTQEQLWAKVENLEKIVARLPGRRA